MTNRGGDARGMARSGESEGRGKGLSVPSKIGGRGGRGGVATESGVPCSSLNCSSEMATAAARGGRGRSARSVAGNTVL